MNILKRERFIARFAGASSKNPARNGVPNKAILEIIKKPFRHVH